MTETATLEEVVGLVEGLGRLGSGVRVAARLAEAGVKGHRQSAEDCPVCRFLSGQTGWLFSVSEDEIAGWRPGRPPRLLVETPASVKQFVRRFDRGNFEELTC